MKFLQNNIFQRQNQLKIGNAIGFPGLEIVDFVCFESVDISSVVIGINSCLQI